MKLKLELTKEVTDRLRRLQREFDHIIRTQEIFVENATAKSAQKEVPEAIDRAKGQLDRLHQCIEQLGLTLAPALSNPKESKTPDDPKINRETELAASIDFLTEGLYTAGENLIDLRNRVEI